MQDLRAEREKNISCFLPELGFTWPPVPTKSKLLLNLVLKGTSCADTFAIVFITCS